LTPTGTACPGTSPTTTPSNTPSPTLTSTPTGTNQVTPTTTNSATPTPTCSYKEWFVLACGQTCSGGICACEPMFEALVYTNCSVTDLTDPSTEIYENSGLSNPFIAFFVVSGSIYYSTGLSVSLECVIGGGC
jgi:hypothetical protein